MDAWRSLLTINARPERLATHAHDVANLLYALVRDGGKPLALKLLEQANALALPLWQALQANAQDGDSDDRPSRAPDYWA